MSEKHEQKVVPNPEGSLGTAENQHKADTNVTNGNDKSRRKFLKGAVAATPVILTVASRPVWARNCSMSGQLSGNLSDQNDAPCSGEGCSPGFWKGPGYNRNLYHVNYPARMLFSEAFGRDAFPGKTLLQVILKEVTDSELNIPYTCTPVDKSPQNTCENLLRELGVQSVAALQNSASPLKYDLDVQTVILSFQKAYDVGTAMALEDTKTAFDRYNNQICPL